MSPIKLLVIFAFFLLLSTVVSSLTTVVPVEQPTEPMEETPLPKCPEKPEDSSSSSASLTVSNVHGKAPITGKIQRKRQSYGFIELTQPEVSQFKSSNILNNTCRIICDAQQDVFIVLMSLHLSQDDYLQIKLKKINGEINDNRFHSLHFSKRSVLVSMVTNTSRVIYDQQSSFSLGYVCINSTHQAEKFSQLKRASKFLENEAVLKYLHCRPQAFKKLASNLTSYPDFNTNDEDILNLIKLKDGEVVKQELPCTNKPLVTEWIESSADGIFE